MAAQSIFSSKKQESSVAEVVAATSKINDFISSNMMAKIDFRDILIGFNILERSLKFRDTEAEEATIMWLRLYLKIQASLSPANEHLQRKYEKTVPSAVTYIIGCLQYKEPKHPTYHYQLLDMVYQLLSNVQTSTIESVANFETGIIACLWFPIDFVGDFNTQMLALRLLVMLLKCVDIRRQQDELNTIHCSETNTLKNKIISAIAVGNYHAAKFDNVNDKLRSATNSQMMNEQMKSLRAKRDQC